MTNVCQAHHALGMTRNPFPPTPDSHSYFYTENLRRDFAETLHCIRSRKGFLLITGEVGLGKSTFVRNLIETLKAEDTAVALVLNTFLQGSALLEAINDDFGLKPTVIKSSIDDPAANLVIQLARLNAYLLRCGQTSKNCVVVIDDAQNLNTDSLELVRLLCNLETMQEKLLQIVVVGQPELLDTLSAPSLRQLKSRIIKHVKLVGLSPPDTAAYVQFRLENAGHEDDSAPIELRPAAIKALFAATVGNPRQMNLILDRCLYGLVATRSRSVSLDLMLLAIDETSMDLKMDRSANDSLQGKSSAAIRPARRSILFRSGPLAMMAAILVPTLALAGWSVWKDDSAPHALPRFSAPVVPEYKHEVAAKSHIQADAPRHAPVPTGVTGPATLSGTYASLGECTARAATQSTAAPQRAQSPMVLRPLTANAIQRYGALLQKRGVACLMQQENLTFLVWQQSVFSAQMSGVPAKNAVQTLQRKLQNLGLLATDEADGWLGMRTREAIKQFQIQYDLPLTGEADALTILLLENFYANHPVNAHRASRAA